MHRTLVDWLALAAATRPDHVAAEHSECGALSYRELDQLSDRVRDRLRRIGVGRGDRVGVYVRKSIDSYASLLGILKTGAAYVPVDYQAPAWRAAFILHDCAVRCVIIEAGLFDAWQQEAAALGTIPSAVILNGAIADGVALQNALVEEVREHRSVGAAAADRPDAGDLAYILYTSGSTGTPKGVMLTHGAAMSFVDWCSEAFQASPDDRFSSHAPFHFDLSILDLFVTLKHAATVVLIGSDQSREPVGLARLIAERRLTVWYSTPTILSWLAQYGRMERHDYGALRCVLFAGEVFPVKHLRLVKDLLPGVPFFNLYGPTETNVCTFHAIPSEIEADRTEPYPIGRPCSHCRSRVVSADGSDVAGGTPGELLIAGPSVMSGYWNQAERTERAFVTDADGVRWYRTGDIVVEEEGGVYRFLGRRDRMVKRRGYRIELGEIEAGLYKHASVSEAAVVALDGGDGDVRIRAYVSGSGTAVPSVIEMKRHCATVLPPYMSPDDFRFVASLPRTSTDKVDYQALARAS